VASQQKVYCRPKHWEQADRVHHKVSSPCGSKMTFEMPGQMASIQEYAPLAFIRFASTTRTMLAASPMK
jgi:hypothetical protein